VGGVKGKRGASAVLASLMELYWGGHIQCRFVVDPVWLRGWRELVSSPLGGVGGGIINPHMNYPVHVAPTLPYAALSQGA